MNYVTEDMLEELGQPKRDYTDTNVGNQLRENRKRYANAGMLSLKVS